MMSGGGVCSASPFQTLAAHDYGIILTEAQPGLKLQTSPASNPRAAPRRAQPSPETRVVNASVCVRACVAARWGGASDATRATRHAMPTAAHAPPPPLAAITARVHARIGLLGNPSDGYGGKALSVSVANFWAEARA